MDKDVQERGATRKEVSVYGLHEKISKHIGERLIKDVLYTVTGSSIEEELEDNPEVKNNPLFYIVPLWQQWKNLAENIKKCCVLVDIINSIIYVIWYGSKLTKTLVGVVIDFNKSKDSINIESFVEWAISDFGFKMVPIYRVDLLAVENEKVILSPLRAYVKGKNTYTILTPTRRPLTVFKDPPNIDFYLPPTDFVEWKWRTKKEKPSNNRRATQELIEMPELIKDKKVSTNSVKERWKIEEEIRDLKLKGEFLHASHNVLCNLRIEYSIPNVEELKIIKNKIEDLEKLKTLKQQALDKVKNSLKNKITHPLKDIDPNTYKIIGWKKFLSRNGETKTVVVLEDPQEPEENSCFNIWPNTKIGKFIDVFTEFFTSNNNPIYSKKIIQTEENKKEVLYTFILYIKDKFFKLKIQPLKSFYNEEGRKIDYFPTTLIQEYKYNGVKEKLEKIEKEYEEALKKYNTTILKDVPLPIGAKKYWCREIPEGEYKVQRITDTCYNKDPLIYLYIIPLENKGNEEEKIVKGHNIELEWRKLINKLDGEKPKHPVICRLGKVKTEVKSKRKFRSCVLICDNNK